MMIFVAVAVPSLDYFHRYFHRYSHILLKFVDSSVVAAILDLQVDNIKS